MSEAVAWEGHQAFFISGTQHDDTVRIEAITRESEDRLTLTLPTLCITYADLQFANDVGGEQENYPASRVYGPRFFDPPVQIDGEAEIEKRTWIKGADRVVIGPEETTIVWWGSRTLIIPRLRIEAGEKAKAVLHVSETMVPVTQPFVVKTLQFADGRHTGGVQLVKRHPEWEPVPDERGYSLWVRVTDGESSHALPEAKVSLFDWSEKGGRFVLEAYWYTNDLGVVEAADLPCADKNLVIVESQDIAPRTWRFRPLPGQEVRQVFRLWPTDPGESDYVWRERDTLEAVAAMGGSTPRAILSMNGLSGVTQIEPGQELRIPCFAPVYRVDARDGLERIGDFFCYSDLDELVVPNQLTEPFEIHEHQGLRLDGWHFFLAGADHRFAEFDDQFGLPTGWTRPAQRTLHDDPALAFEGELVAVPTRGFAAEHELTRPQ